MQPVTSIQASGKALLDSHMAVAACSGARQLDQTITRKPACYMCCGDLVCSPRKRISWLRLIASLKTWVASYPLQTAACAISCHRMRMGVSVGEHRMLGN